MKTFRLGLAVLLLASCSPKDDKPGTAIAKPPVPAAPAGATKTMGGVAPAGDDTLMLYYPNDPNTINPIIGNDTVSEDFQRWVLDQLAEQKFENPDEWVPVLAEKWDFDEKNLEYTIHLRKGVKWHPAKLPDGTPLPRKEVTAVDVKFTFDAILNPHVDAAAMRSYYEDPEAKTKEEKYKIRVSIVDPYTVKIKWTKPYFMIDEWTLALPIMPKHVYGVDAKGEPLSNDTSSEEFAKGFNDHWANSTLVGTGPMMMSGWKKNERLELVRNPDYWGEPFYFSKVVFRNIPNSNTSLEMTLNNELDWSIIAEKSLYIQTREKPQVKEGKAKTAEFDYPGYRYIGWNVKREIFRERAVRNALSHAIPVQKIIDKVLYGLGTRLSGPFLPTSPNTNPECPLIPYDPDKSRKLLDEAGWKDSNNNGTRDKTINGRLFEMKFDFMIYADTAMYKTIAEVVKEEFRQIGIDVQISPVKWALMLEKLHKKEFDACMLGWALPWKQDLFQTWHSSQADTMESSNAIGYKNPDLDKLIEKLRVTTNKEEQRRIYREMHKLIYDDQPYTFMFVDKRTAVHHARMQNIKYYKIRPAIDMREWHSTVARAQR